MIFKGGSGQITRNRGNFLLQELGKAALRLPDAQVFGQRVGGIDLAAGQGGNGGVTAERDIYFGIATLVD